MDEDLFPPKFLGLGLLFHSAWKLLQQLERKQQKPPHSSIPGRAREEQMPPKQMFKVRRSANDQVRVAFQVTYVPAPLLRARTTFRRVFFPAGSVLRKLRSFLAEGAIQGQQLRSADKKVKMGRRKRSKPGAGEEHKGAIVGSETWHLPLNRMERLNERGEEARAASVCTRGQKNRIDRVSEPFAFLRKQQLHSFYPQIHVPRNSFLSSLPLSSRLPLIKSFRTSRIVNLL